MPKAESATVEVERVFREAYGQAVATLVRVFGDVTLAEDAVQDAFTIALKKWPEGGVPPNPAGWIITTARNRAIDHLRRDKRGRILQGQIHGEANGESDLSGEVQEEAGPVSDDQLRLMFTCCHPALRIEHQVALTLRLMGGLSVEQVARSFIVSEPTMSKRLVRAKYKIRAANIPYRIPSDSDLPERLRSVLAVLYLIYNAGAEDVEQRSALRDEAVRLVRSLQALMPDEPEVAGLLALMLLNESRVPARSIDGVTVLLRDQDRTKWNRTLIEEGHAIVRSCINQNRPGPYQVQASIQAVHCFAETFEDTDWKQIVDLYDHLYAIAPTSIIALNRAIALSETEGAGPALAAIDSLTVALDGYHLMHAARGTLLRDLGETGAARIAYGRALELASSDTDRQFLSRQIEEIDSD